MEPSASARADLIGAALWVALGAAIVFASWTMDRLAQLNINPYTVPGLVPGLLGGGIALLGLALGARALRAGALGPGGLRAAADRIGLARVGLAGALCFVYAAALLGRLPFRVATALFVFAFMVLFEYAERRARGQLGRGVIAAAATGAVVSLAVAFVFEDLFLVRLP